MALPKTTAEVNNSFDTVTVYSQNFDYGHEWWRPTYLETEGKKTLIIYSNQTKLSTDLR